MSTNRKAKKIIRKYRKNRATLQERALVDSWFLSKLKQTEINCSDYNNQQALDDIWEHVRPEVLKRRSKVIFIQKAAAAAAVVTGIIITSVLFIKNRDQNQPIAAAQPVKWNTITTADREKRTEILPDGSTAILNEESYLRYSQAFSLTERNVEVIGEVYFKVKKDANLPFVVNTPTRTVTVLGTEFNVRSYPNQHAQITLALGKVQVSSRDTGGPKPVELKPGQQVVGNDVMQIREVNVASITAWQTGLFKFSKTNLKDALAELAQWYNVRVDYTNIPINKKVDGECSREDSLSTILKHIGKINKIELILKDKRISVK